MKCLPDPGSLILPVTNTVPEEKGSGRAVLRPTEDVNIYNCGGDVRRLQGPGGSGIGFRWPTSFTKTSWKTVATEKHSNSCILPVAENILSCPSDLHSPGPTMLHHSFHGGWATVEKSLGTGPHQQEVISQVGVWFLGNKSKPLSCTSLKDLGIKVERRGLISNTASRVHAFLYTRTQG